MDIYRYFHPHHNPRLFSTPLRQQELSELEQAASEIRKALERARLRTERAPAGRILPTHFTDVMKAIRFIESSLQTLSDAHDGDEPEVLQDLVQERSGLRGWEAWTSIVREQLASEEYSQKPVHLEREEGDATTSGQLLSVSADGGTTVVKLFANNTEPVTDTTESA